ncbi:MAG: hypothetical protein ACOCS8_00135, partial [Desulfovermiculus sp.]
MTFKPPGNNRIRFLRSGALHGPPLSVQKLGCKGQWLGSVSLVGREWKPRPLVNGGHGHLVKNRVLDYSWVI